MIWTNDDTYHRQLCHQGAFQYKNAVFTNIGSHIIKIRQFHDCLNFIMGITIPGKTVFILKQGRGLNEIQIHVIWSGVLAETKARLL